MTSSRIVPTERIALSLWNLSRVGVKRYGRPVDAILERGPLPREDVRRELFRLDAAIAFIAASRALHDDPGALEVVHSVLRGLYHDSSAAANVVPRNEAFEKAKELRARSIAAARETAPAAAAAMSDDDPAYMDFEGLMIRVDGYSAIPLSDRYALDIAAMFMDICGAAGDDVLTSCAAVHFRVFCAGLTEVVRLCATGLNGTAGSAE